ncbi:MAG: NAD(P)-binding domain-containing protein, partial [Candidatus Omnitrophica bacterium]|nr:NAD(P)-binding domain-containing protein [Candidatus Omnitrophota bacterium]
MKIGIIGCGNMGQALLKGIIAKRYARSNELLISDKDKRKRRAVYLRFKVGVASSNSDLVARSKVIIVAVKPQDLEELAGDIAVPLKGKLVISICAGITTARLQSVFGKISVVRVMPNMPVVI